MSIPIWHSLPNARTVMKFGSSQDGKCSSVIHNSTQHLICRGSVCNGVSVLNDGVIPALSEVHNDSSLWAAELLTMRQMNKRITVLSALLRVYITIFLRFFLPFLLNYN